MARKLPIPNGRLDGALDANGMRIVNLMDPMSDDDAATKGFVKRNAVNAGVSKVNGHDGDVTLTGEDVPFRNEEGAMNVASAIMSIQDAVTSHADRNDNPHNVKANDVGAYTRAEVDALIMGIKNNSVEISGEYEDGTAFSFNVLKRGE